jgi:hypothetical protein
MFFRGVYHLSCPGEPEEIGKQAIHRINGTRDTFYILCEFRILPNFGHFFFDQS